MQKEEIKFADSTVFEGMTSIRAIIKGSEDGINDRKIEKILFDYEKIKKIGKEVGYLKAVSEKYGFTVEKSSKEQLDALAVGSSHGGLIAITGKRSLPCLTESFIKPNGFYAMIDGIEDPYNFGYSIRSLYPMGCEGLILPERNWLSAAGVVCRSSAGASERLPVCTSEPITAAEIFKSKGYKIVCADERTDNILGQCELKLPILLIVGGEKRGISKAVLDKADILIKIGYEREFKASLSAASATTMFAYEIARQNIAEKNK